MKNNEKEQLIESLPNLIWIAAITISVGALGGDWCLAIIVGLSILFGFAIGYEQGLRRKIRK